jgi:N-acetylglucosaminyl-diphospho-decaprenol L-rhamnosyltransferase
MAAVSILIVTFNSAHVVLDCLNTVAHIEEAEVIVYDNSSSDETVESIRRKFPSVQIIEGTDNAGFAVGVNRAAVCATSPRIMLLNPDAVIDPDSVRVLVASVDKQEFSVVAPLITHPEGAVKVASAGHFPTPSAMAAHYSGLSRFSRVRGHYLLLKHTRPQQRTAVDWVSGACLITARSTWDAVGGLDERWFMYAEDIDFCWRVSRIGGAMVMDSRATTSHLVGASDGARSTVVNSMWVKNLYDFYALRMSPNRVSTLLWGTTVTAGLLVRSLVFSAQRRPNSAHQFRNHAAVVAGSIKQMVWRDDG